MDLEQKLVILADSAKYDVACTSSGTVRSGKDGMLGNSVGGAGSDKLKSIVQDTLK